jgi:hypothetical protein
MRAGGANGRGENAQLGIPHWDELVDFVRPHIVRDPIDIQDVEHRQAPRRQTELWL